MSGPGQSNPTPPPGLKAHGQTVGPARRDDDDTILCPFLSFSIGGQKFHIACEVDLQWENGKILPDCCNLCLMGKKLIQETGRDPIHERLVPKQG